MKARLKARVKDLDGALNLKFSWFRQFENLHSMKNNQCFPPDPSEPAHLICAVTLVYLMNP